MYVDVACAQERKHGQTALGDYFACRRRSEEGRVLAVLSDGLGSGIKASIMARMTATMLLGFLEADLDPGRAAATVMGSLPVCRERGLSYATFSMVDCDDEGRVRVVEEGNPDFVWLRGDRPVPAPYELIESGDFPGRHVRLYDFEVEEGDRLVLVSDGVTQAGLGWRGRSGLGRQGLIDFLRTRLERQGVLDAQRLCRHVLDLALSLSPGGKAADDVSAAVVHFRVPRRCLVFTGPPFERRRDAYYAAIFREFPGPKAVCGGTTAQLLARELGRPLKVAGEGRGGLPPASVMEGVDLVTEGLVTMTRAIRYLETGDAGRADAAGSLTRFLLGHDVIHVMEGTGVNLANFDPSMVSDHDIRRNVVRRLSEVLRTRHLKSVRIQRV